MSWRGGWGRALAACVSEPFTRATGVPVEHAYHVGLKLPPALLAALDTGRRSPFDVVWSNAVPALRVAQQGGCRLLDEAVAPNLHRLGARADFLARAGGWPIAVPYVVHYVLVYRKGAFSEAGPASYTSLLDPRHRGRIAMYPGGNGFYPIAQLLGGGHVSDIPGDMRACWDFVRALRPQVGCLEYSVGMGAKFAAAELDLAFRALTNALAFREEGVDVGWVVPREGVTDTIDALWIPRTVPDDAAYWAERYIDFALSVDVQTTWCRALGVMPSHRGATVPAIFHETPGLPTAVDDLGSALHVPEQVKVEHELAWEARWDAIMRGEE
jgi:putative spermidine/putrescine transport system substrate-binding protein